MVDCGIRERRKQLGLSIYKLAKLTNLSAGYINNLENSRKLNPSKKTMVKIAEALKVSVDEIFF